MFVPDFEEIFRINIQEIKGDKGLVPIGNCWYVRHKVYTVYIQCKFILHVVLSASHMYIVKAIEATRGENKIIIAESCFLQNVGLALENDDGDRRGLQIWWGQRRRWLLLL